MKKRKGPVALVLIALAADVGYVLLKSAKIIRDKYKKSEKSDGFKGEKCSFHSGFMLS